jgi:hypothetical protein
VADSKGEEARRVIDAELRPGEVFRVMFPVLIPPPDLGGGWGPAAVIIPLFWAVRKLMWRRAAGAVQVQVGIPLRYRMVWGTTDQRVLIFALRARWRLGPLIASVDRGDIVGATATTVGEGWRTVELELSGQRTLSVKVPAPWVNPIVNGFGQSPS